MKNDNWELVDLNSRWHFEMAKAEQQLVDGWNTIIKQIVKYVNYSMNNFKSQDDTVIDCNFEFQAQRNKVTPPSEGNVELICRTLDALIGHLLVEWRQENMNNFIDWLTERENHQVLA